MWAKFDDGYMDHPKVMEAGPWAELLDRRAIEYCAKYETDGVLSRKALKHIGRDIPRVPQRVAMLVSVGRWLPHFEGWEVHDFLKYNPSKAEREAIREQNRDRQRAHRERDREKSNAVTDASVTNGTGNTRKNVSLCDSLCARCGGVGFRLNEAGDVLGPCRPSLAVVEGGQG